MIIANSVPPIPKRTRILGLTAAIAEIVRMCTGIPLGIRFTIILMPINISTSQFSTRLPKPAADVRSGHPIRFPSLPILFYIMVTMALAIKRKTAQFSLLSPTKHKIPEGLNGTGFIDVPYQLRIYIPKNSTVFIDKKDGSPQTSVNGPQFYTVKKNERIVIKFSNHKCYFQYALVTLLDTIPAQAKKPWQKELRRIKNYDFVKGDSINFNLHRQLFYNLVPKCFNITLNEKDTVHPFRCEKQTSTNIALMPASAKKLSVVGQYCLTYDLKAVDFSLEDTKPGCMRSFAKINPDFINTPNNWILINDLYTGEKVFESAMSPPPFAYQGYNKVGPASNRFYLVYNDTLLGNENVQKLNVALIIGNGIDSNYCVDTIYYPNFVSFPRLSSNLSFVGKNDTTVLYNTCAQDTVYVTIPHSSPDANELASSSSWYMIENSTLDTVSMVIENYHKVESNPRFKNKKVNYTVIERYVQKKGYQQLVKRDTIFTAIVHTWKTKTLPGYSSRKLKAALAAIDLDIDDFNDSNVLDVIWNNKGTIGNYASGSRGCIDTNGMDTPFPFLSDTAYLHPAEL